MKTMQEIYLEGQAACGLKVGDQVKVLRQPKDGEYGWDNVAPVHDCTGLTGIIILIDEEGIRVKFEKTFLDYPYFVLEKIEKIKHKYDFKPFDKVLVRNDPDSIWFPAFFCSYTEDNLYPFYTVYGMRYKQCIPYEGNEELLLTMDNPKNDNEK